MIDSIANTRIGIVIASIGLLTLLYPLMYSYLANLMQQLFALQKQAQDSGGSVELDKTRIQLLESYYDVSSFTLNIFFPTGLGFIFSFILLQFFNEYHLSEGILKWLISLTFVFLFVWVIFLWCHEMKPENTKFYKFLFSRESRFLLWFIPYWGYLIYALIFLLSIPNTQYYCLLLNYGLLLGYLVCLWFGEGIYFRSIRNLQFLRRQIL